MGRIDADLRCRAGLAPALLFSLGLSACTRDAAQDAAAGAAGAITVADAGFQTPESVLHDPAADVYLVSNINGSPLEKDDNGFISRVAPTGEVVALRWIDGQAENVTLNAPKGMAIRGDTLFVADIDAVRAFHRETGEPLGSRAIEGATFVNDLAVGPDGTVYATDSGLTAGDQGFAPSGTDAVYRFGPADPAPVARGPELNRPNGIAVDDRGVLVAPFGGSEIYRIGPSGVRTAVATLPAGSLDGVVRRGDGTVLVSSWDAQAVYLVDASGTARVAVDSVEAPADIGYDARRDRVLIPLFTLNRIEIRPVR